MSSALATATARVSAESEMRLLGGGAPTRDNSDIGRTPPVGASPRSIRATFYSRVRTEWKGDLEPVWILIILIIGLIILILPGRYVYAGTPLERAEERAEQAADRAEQAAETAEAKLESIKERTITKSNPDPSPVNDTWLTAKTKLALVGDERVKGRQITVETKKGKVFLRGKVDTEAAKEAAEEIAKGVEGVSGVKNNLQVVAPSKREVIEEKDDAITARVKTKLNKEPKLKSADIDVRTDAGIVTLSGEVRDLSASAQAAWVAWQAKGVRSVRNEVTLKKPKT